jgi:hypothetical protein
VIGIPLGIVMARVKGRWAPAGNVGQHLRQRADLGAVPI